MVRAEVEEPILGFVYAPGSESGAERGPDDLENRIESWIVCHLDDRDETSAIESLWTNLIGPVRVPNPARRDRAKPAEQRSVSGGWTRFRLSRRSGIAIVRLIDRELVKESEVRELGEDLLALIAAGYPRIVLNCVAVERLTSWVAGALAEAHRRCAAAGGVLKICGLRPLVGDLFRVAGLDRDLAVFPDEDAAIASPWPEPLEPRPLPVTILSALTGLADPAAPDEPESLAPEVFPPSSLSTPPSALRADLPEAPPTMPAVWLIVQGGRAHGKSIAVTGPQFVIGRDASCQLRPRSEAISRKHAALEWREGRWVLSDLGSTNGTALNGRLLRSKSAEVHHGDLIRIGPVAFTLAIDQPQADVGLDDLIASWLKDEMPEAHSAAAEIAEETAIYPLAETPEAGFSVRHEVIEDILVVTPVVSALDDEATVGQLRAELRGLYERALPRWVVVNLEYVGHLSSKAVGVLVAHHLRLDRAGGALRIGQPRAPVMAMLDQIRLPVLIECYPTLDEAVLEPWPGAAVRREAR